MCLDPTPLPSCPNTGCRPSTTLLPPPGVRLEPPVDPPPFRHFPLTTTPPSTLSSNHHTSPASKREPGVCVWTHRYLPCTPGVCPDPPPSTATLACRVCVWIPAANHPDSLAPKRELGLRLDPPPPLPPPPSHTEGAPGPPPPALHAGGVLDPTTTDRVYLSSSSSLIFRARIYNPLYSTSTIEIYKNIPKYMEIYTLVSAT